MYGYKVGDRVVINTGYGDGKGHVTGFNSEDFAPYLIRVLADDDRLRGDLFAWSCKEEEVRKCTEVK